MGATNNTNSTNSTTPTVTFDELTAEPATSKKCSQCGTSKPYTVAHWYSNLGTPVGTVCLACSKARSKRYKQERKQELKERKPQGPALVVPPSLPALRVKQLDAALALKQGAEMLNEHAAAVLIRIVAYAGDPESVHHEWALKMLGERILPAKMFAELGAHAAGVADRSSKLPKIEINVFGAPPQPVDVPTITVEPLEERRDADMGRLDGADAAGAQREAREVADGRGALEDLL